MFDLGPDKGQAFARFAELVAQAADAAGLTIAQPVAAGVERRGTVADLVPQYVADIRHRLKPKTAADTADRLAWLAKRFGECEVSALDPLAVERQAHREGWRRGTVRQTLTAAQAFARWCGAKAFRVRIPSAEYRGPECVLTPDEFVRAERAAPGDYAAYLRVLWETGARPGEVRRLTAELVDWRKCLAVLKDHKTAKSGRVRTILFTPAAMAALGRQRDRHTTGPLFRNSHGRPYTLNGVSILWRRVMAETGIRVPTVYAMRHAYITDRLEAGVPAARVAALVGTSLLMIEKTYSHVGQNIDGLRQVAARLDGAA